MSQVIYDRVTSQILTALEGSLPAWRKPWRDLRATGATSIPTNAISGKAYRGLNFVLLAMTGYADQRWVTFRQAQQLGGYVRKGEHGRTIVFWNVKNIEDKDSGTTKRAFLMRNYTVFNVEQCEGLNLKAPLISAAPPADLEAIYGVIGAQVEHGGNTAAYLPVPDRIRLPRLDQFSSGDAYAATALHEVGHWTGHATRLNRDLSGRFRSNAYAAEELVAELTATFLCAELGINMTLEHHAAYIASWRALCADDARAIVTAASKAQAAAEFVLSRLGRRFPDEQPEESLAMAA